MPRRTHNLHQPSMQTLPGCSPKSQLQDSRPHMVPRLSLSRCHSMASTLVLLRSLPISHSQLPLLCKMPHRLVLRQLT